MGITIIIINMYVMGQTALRYIINPQRMRNGYGSRSVCVCVTVTTPAATYVPG